MESITRSPIYSHFGETISGAATIRAYGVAARFVRENEKKIDLNQARKLILNQVQYSIPFEFQTAYNVGLLLPDVRVQSLAGSQAGVNREPNRFLRRAFCCTDKRFGRSW